jgi:Tfp pilus assembly protein PilX
MMATRARIQSGAALLIALALLVILGILGTAGMRMSIAELMMAGNEQFRNSAELAASAGVEAGIARISQHSAAGTLTPNLEGEGYTASIRYAGNETTLPGSSLGKFVGRHYEITSKGTSARRARDEQVQGVMVVSAVAEGVTTFRQTGAGLESEGTP